MRASPRDDEKQSAGAGRAGSAVLDLPVGDERDAALGELWPVGLGLLEPRLALLARVRLAQVEEVLARARVVRVRLGARVRAVVVPRSRVELVAVEVVLRDALVRHRETRRGVHGPDGAVVLLGLLELVEHLLERVGSREPLDVAALDVARAVRVRLVPLRLEPVAVVPLLAEEVQVCTGDKSVTYL